MSIPVIDAHQHVWQLARGDYGWLTPVLEPLYRDFDLTDLEPQRAAAGVTGTVLVQAAPTVAETEFLLGLAAEHALVRGVVGWIDFELPDAPAMLARLAEDPRLVGLRPMIQDLEDDEWMLRPELEPAFGALEERGLAFDALVLPRHLPHLAALLDRRPALRAIVDHGAKPEVRRAGDPRALARWRADLARVARHERVFCKLSGLVTEAAPDWTVADLQPFTDALFELFGPERLVWGSDWPVVELAGGYAAWWSATNTLLAPLDPPGRAAVLGGNAIRFYDLEPPSEVR